MSRLVRPWLPLAALILAALACSVEVSTAHLHNPRLYNQPDRAANATRSFDAGDTVYCLTDLRDAGSPLVVEIVWVALLVEDQHTAESELHRESLTAENGPLVFQFGPPPGGWTRGDYRVRLYLDGDREAELPFRVR